MRFLVDENLPRKLSKFLENLGYEVLDVAKTSYRGSSDETLWELADKEQFIIITRDLDFPLPASDYQPLGLILIRAPDQYNSEDIVNLFGKTLDVIKIDELQKNIVVISPKKVRFRKL